MSLNEIKVWDLFVRGFHWSLVLLFVVTYLSGEELHTVHIYSGYGILILLGLRVIWGFIGSKYARFSDFVTSPAAVIDYLKSLRTGSPKHYLGHNPAGGAMVIALLLSLTAAGVSGYLMDESTEQEGMLGQSGYQQDRPLTQPVFLKVSDDEEHEGSERGEGGILKDAHEFFANLTVLLVFLHVLGVIVSSRLHDENLVRAMVTGKKTVPTE